MRKLILALAVLLAACGGGEPEDFVELEAAPRAAMEAPAIVVRMHGDSTQVGAHTGGINSATVAQSILNDMGRSHITVIGEGIGGTTTQLRLYGGVTKNGVTTVKPWPEVITDKPADIVTFRYGINDAKWYPPALFRDHVNRLIDLSEAAGMSVILETPSPTEYEKSPESASTTDLLNVTIQKNIERNVKVLRRIATERPSVTFCNHLGNGFRFGYENRDYIHPTAYAYETWIGHKAADCILIAVKKRAGR